MRYHHKTKEISFNAVIFYFILFSLKEIHNNNNNNFFVKKNNI